MTQTSKMKKYGWLAGVVMAWTVFTTTFLWTPTMRGFFRPDISVWGVMEMRGAGREGSFWIFPALAAVALFLFYLEGRNRLRPLFHLLLLAWHLALTGIIVYGTILEGAGGYFEGAMWGVRIPLPWLSIPFVAFSALASLWVVRERHGFGRSDVAPWGQVHWKTLGVAALLLPLAVLLFHLGEGFDWKTKLGTAVTVVQWILLTQALAYHR